MKQLGRYFIILVLILVLWNTIIIKPIKLFTVYLHELGHAFMAFIFGYGIQGFKVNLNESGYTIVQAKGWLSSFMIANGGYLGSVLFALLILYLKRTKFKKFIFGSLAILFLGVALRFSGLSFTLLFASLFAIFVIILYMIQNEKITDWAIDVFGVASVAYAIYDTFVDTVLLQVNIYFGLLGGWNKQPMTDAAQLAQMTHVPAIVWGIIWLAISLFAVYAVLVKGTGKSRARK